MICTQEHSLTEYLTLVKPYVSSQLIDTESWFHIEAIANLLPSQLTNFFGFECRLGTEAAKADFLLCIGAAEVGQKILTSESALCDSLLKEPVWQQIRNFTSCWQNQTLPLHSNVDNIWLEFDVDGHLDQAPIPSCFFGSQTIHAASSTHTWVTQNAIQLLRGHSLPLAVEKQLFKCLEALPTNVYVFQVGLMLARRSDMVRICLRGISPGQIIDYLSQIGWSGSTDGLKTLLEELSIYVERIDLDLDVGETGVAAKIGLECYLTLQPKYEPRWMSFLDYLLKVGLCLPQKRDALLTYPGYVREKNHRNQWPSHLLKLSQFLGPNHENVFMRGLHHIKVVYQSERAIEAKAYCWVTHSLLSKQADYPTHQEVSLQLDNFLTSDEHQRLFDYVTKNESGFVKSETYEDTGSSRYYRHSLIYDPKFPEFSDLITERIREHLPEILTKLNITQFLIAGIEAQLTAHNDGNYFKLHNDNGLPQVAARRITFVYYFCREPKSFSGGELRLFNSTTKNTSKSLVDFQVIEPRNNSIIFFPSEYLHEVLPVICPSMAFVDSRFTINGWIWQVDAALPSQPIDS
jgi:Rps23 Pro-64 3,4-dihydroxylase Tpa1-like proline 4-hydroxylase